MSPILAKHLQLIEKEKKMFEAHLESKETTWLKTTVM